MKKKYETPAIDMIAFEVDEPIHDLGGGGSTGSGSDKGTDLG